MPSASSQRRSDRWRCRRRARSSRWAPRPPGRWRRCRDARRRRSGAGTATASRSTACGGPGWCRCRSCGRCPPRGTGPRSASTPRPPHSGRPCAGPPRRRTAPAQRGRRTPRRPRAWAPQPDRGGHTHRARPRAPPTPLTPSLAPDPWVHRIEHQFEKQSKSPNSSGATAAVTTAEVRKRGPGRGVNQQQEQARPPTRTDHLTFRAVPHAVTACSAARFPALFVLGRPTRLLRVLDGPARRVDRPYGPGRPPHALRGASFFGRVSAGWRRRPHR